MHISNLTRKCWNHCSGPRVWFKQVCWMSGLYFQILTSITWYTSVCFSFLYMSLWLSFLVNSGLHHTGPLAWKFNNHWSGNEEIYGLYETLWCMKACHWTLSWDMWIWSTLYVPENCFNIILLSGLRSLGVFFPWMFLSNIFMHFLFLVYLLSILPNHCNNIWWGIQMFTIHLPILCYFFLISNILLNACFPATVCLLFIELQGRFNFHVK